MEAVGKTTTRAGKEQTIAKIREIADKVKHSAPDTGPAWELFNLCFEENVLDKEKPEDQKLYLEAGEGMAFFLIALSGTRALKGSNDCAILNNTALLFERGNDWRSAVEWYKRIAEADPNNPERYFRVACAYEEIPGNQDQAIAWYQKALDVDPCHISSHFELAMHHKFKGEFALALESFEKYLLFSNPANPPRDKRQFMAQKMIPYLKKRMELFGPVEQW